MSRIKVVIAVSIAALLLCVSCVLAGEQFKQSFDKSLPLKAGDRFSLANVNGGVSVSTWAEDWVEIKAVKTARGHEEDLDKVEIRVEEVAGGVSVKAVWPKFPRRANVDVEFTVRVPEGVVLDEVETVNGDVAVRGRYSRARVGTTNGSVTVEDGAGELEADTTNGSIRVSRFDGRVKAETTNGQIKLDAVALKDGLSAETTNGGITVSVASPETLNADLRASTTNGHVSVDFPITLQNLSQSKRRIEGRIGQGGPEIRLHTTNGSISLTR